MRMVSCDPDRDVVVTGGTDGCKFYSVSDLNARLIGVSVGSFSDVEISEEGYPYALHIKPGNPATITLRAYSEAAPGGNFTTRNSPKPPIGGRISSSRGYLAWQTGDIVTFIDTTTNDVVRSIQIGSNAYDVAACYDEAIGVCAIVCYGREIVKYDSRGNVVWRSVAPTVVRKLMAADNYMVAWGALEVVNGAAVLPVSVLDVNTGEYVAKILQSGPGFMACAVPYKNFLITGSPVYKPGQSVTGRLDVFDLSSNGDGVASVDLLFPPLDIGMAAGGLVVVSNEIISVVSRANLKVNTPELTSGTNNLVAPIDPYEAFLVTQPDLTANEIGFMSFVSAYFPQNSVAGYVTILNAIRKIG